MAETTANTATSSPSASKRPQANPKESGKKAIPSLRKPNQMVTLYAGDSGEAFTVHKEFACHYSPVLKAAFNSNFVEGQTQTYRLQETTERAVCLLVQWFYTQKLDIFVPESEEDAKSGEYIAAKVSQDMSLVELWILAEKLLIPALQNLVAKGIEQCRLQANAISTTSLHYVYEKTERGSLLRRLMVDICFSHLRITSYLTHPDRYPQEMLIELVTVFGNETPASARNKAAPKKDFSRYQVPEE